MLVTGTNAGAGVTVTVQFAVNPPSSVVAVIVAVPADTAVITPELFTVAVPALPDDHITVLFVAFAGATVAVSVSLVPATSVVVVLFKVTPAANTGSTVTSHEAIKPPSVVVTVTNAVPGDTAVTTPPGLTVATVASLLAHDMALFVAVAGATVAVKVSVAPAESVVYVLFNVTPVTGTAVGIEVNEAAAPAPTALPARTLKS